MAFPKYQTKEVLNKILNSAETAIQVDIVAGAEYAEDAAHTSSDTGNFILGVRNDTLAALGGTDGDYVPFQMNSDGALYVEISSGGSADAAHVDDAGFTLGTHSGMMMMGFAGTQSVDANDAGAIAMETDGSIHIHDGGNTITVDGTVTANLGTTDNAVLDAIAASLALLDNSIQSGNELQVDIVASLPAGSAAIGKLAANSGVDIGDVDVTSVIPGVAATNLGKAIQSAQGSTDTGVAALAVRNDALADLSGADGDYTPLQVNKTGALNVTENTGYLGAIFEDGADDITGKKVIAIQFLEDTTFTTLTPVDSSYIGTASGNGDAIDTSNTFPQGMTIFGRWTGYRLASGTIVAYQGDW